MKVIVAGSRGFKDYELLCKKLDLFLSNVQVTEIVSGTADGADQLGEMYAGERGYQIAYFPANWKEYGKSAGYRRNEEMAEYADAAVVFWDGSSRGTGHMIDLARKHGLKLKIVRYE